jgi:RNA polymerase sigma-70 factor, ECF subfamily
VTDLSPLDGPAASALFREHGRALRAFLGARVRDPSVVDDLCQETFAAALDRGVPPDGVGRWLFAIARNKALKHMRDTRETATAVADPPAPDAAPGARLEGDEERARVRAAVSALDEELREAVLLRYEGGLDYKAIAGTLDVPVSTIQGRLKRARVALRAALEGRAS